MEAKNAIDKIINKTRVHFYKPIQIAEVLFHYRHARNSIVPSDLNTYRTASKKWRDDVTSRLVGSLSTSSSKFQDDVFNDSAMPPLLLDKLAQLNKKYPGMVEAYIYRRMEVKFKSINEIRRYITASTAENFSLSALVEMFDKKGGLKKSMDKVYEIITYSLFLSIVKALNAQVTLEVLNKDEEVLRDFKSFIKTVLGIDETTTKLISPASLYRVGSTNAADAGLDMWANFGPAFQVKHLSLSSGWIEKSSDKLLADKLIIICKDGEKTAIASIISQLGLQEKIQGIITFSDLKEWYELAMSKKYRQKLGTQILEDLGREFNNEFPAITNLHPFIKERGYQNITMLPEWQIQD